jgi:predicted nuclease with TOPRIM domain
MGKFTERKKEVDEIQELFSEKDEIKNKNVEKKFEIDNIKINIKVADRIKTDLMNKFRNNKRKIFNIKKEISETENKIKEKEVILNRLNKINKNYNYIFQKAQKRK